MIHPLSSVQKGKFRNKGYKFYSNVEHYNYAITDAKAPKKFYSLSCSVALLEDEPGSPDAMS